MIYSPRFGRYRNPRGRPWLERLESRDLLSLSVVALDPIPGVHLTTAPTAVTITFNRPIDPTSLSNNDIQLDQVDNGGGRTSINDVTEAVGPRDDQLILKPGQPLWPGHYEIFLARGSGLLSTDLEGLSGDGTDQAFGNFWIVAKGVGLGDAIDLGTPGPIPTSIPGALDFRANPEDVKLYKITLPDGHFWRLGVEVSSERDGGSLDSALALFDDQGRPIATDDLGRQDAPQDPFLFAGLRPGTYYVGVSGIGNLSGEPRGYDPATSSAGSVPQTQAGGLFTLHIVADPADAPISLLSFTTDHADPLDPNPTGLSLQFSGSLRLNPEMVNRVMDLDRSIEVVDATGHVHPVEVSSYSEAEARISFLFQDRLPEGRYTVRWPEQGGLVDLAGYSPVAPGQPAGVLGTFGVGPDQAKDPLDLGALTPALTKPGIARDTPLDPGASVTYRFVILDPSFFVLRTYASGGPLALTITDSDRKTVLDAKVTDPYRSPDVNLSPGGYYLSLSNTGSVASTIHWSLKAAAIIIDYLSFGSIGRGPALNLRLIAPAIGAPTPPISTPPISMPPPASTPPASTPPVSTPLTGVPVAPTPSVDVPTIATPSVSVPASTTFSSTLPRSDFLRSLFFQEMLRSLSRNGGGGHRLPGVPPAFHRKLLRVGRLGPGVVLPLGHDTALARGPRLHDRHGVRVGARVNFGTAHRPATPGRTTGDRRPGKASGRLKVAKKLAHADTLNREFLDYRVKVTPSAHETFATREGQHDDLVLALALPLWLGRQRFIRMDPDLTVDPVERNLDLLR
jgi:hypothetical protein